MAKKLLVVGGSSYLASGLCETCSGIIDAVSIPRWEEHPPLEAFDAVVNFTIQGEFFSERLGDSDLIDAAIARELRPFHGILVMMSSRRVYGSTAGSACFTESDALHPADYYARNKVRAEMLVRELLPERHLILRISNVLSSPVDKSGYRTFMGWISSSLKEKGVLEVSECPETRKDFITRSYLHEAIVGLVAGNALGTVNVGSGFALPFSEWMPAIVPDGCLTFLNPGIPPKDQFVLDVGRLMRYVRPFTPLEFITRCKRIKSEFEDFTKRACHENCSI